VESGGIDDPESLNLRKARISGKFCFQSLQALSPRFQNPDHEKLTKNARGIDGAGACWQGGSCIEEDFQDVEVSYPIIQIIQYYL
jgi:hypothetical protein